MSTYRIVMGVVGTETHYVEADTEDEAREMVLSGESPDTNPIINLSYEGIDSIDCEED